MRVQGEEVEEVGLDEMESTGVEAAALGSGTSTSGAEEWVRQVMQR